MRPILYAPSRCSSGGSDVYICSSASVLDTIQAIYVRPYLSYPYRIVSYAVTTNNKLPPIKTYFLYYLLLFIILFIIIYYLSLKY
jgi:hypothetical protein